MFEVEVYETESGNSPVRDFLSKLTKENKQNEITQIYSYIKRLKEYGMAVNFTYHETIKPLRDDIYELRPGKNRIFFIYYTGKKFILLHAYRKFKQKAPPSEIKQAIKEKDDYIRRNGK